MQSHCEPWACFPASRESVNTGEASLAGLQLTSCWVAQFLTGHGLDRVQGLGLADPSFRRESILASNSFWWFQELLALCPCHSNFCLYVWNFLLFVLSPLLYLFFFLDYHHCQLELLLGKMGASKICMLQTYFTQWASDLYTNSCWSLVKEWFLGH